MQTEKLVYETDEYTYSFKNFQAIKTFGPDIYEGEVTIKEADEYQTDLLTEILDFRTYTKPRREEKNQKKKLFCKTCIIFLRVEKKFLMLLKVRYLW